MTQDNTVIVKARARMIAGAKNYAASEKSDPFAYSRAMTHIDNGIAEPMHRDGGTAFYDAEPYIETRTYERDGVTVEYQATAYRNVQRP